MILFFQFYLTVACAFAFIVYRLALQENYKPFEAFIQAVLTGVFWLPGLIIGYAMTGI